MKRGLQLLFGAIFVAMLVVTVRASLEQSVWAAWPAYRENPWAVATLWDAYFGFLTVYVWVWYREAGWGGRLLWLVLFAGLGNIAMSLYVLLALRGLPAGAGLEELLKKREGR